MCCLKSGSREGGVIAGQDTAKPKLLSIDIVGAPHTRAASVQFMVQFSALVSGLEPRHFRLMASGSANGVIASVLRLGGDACLVTVDDVSGAGAMRLAPSEDAVAAWGGIALGHHSNAHYMIDRVTPAVKRLSIPADGMYPAGAHLDFVIAFSVPVTVDGGLPTLTIALPCGASLRAPLFKAAEAQLTFRHTAVGNVHLNRMGLARSIDLNGAIMRDSLGNHANPTLDGALMIEQMLIDDVAAYA